MSRITRKILLIAILGIVWIFPGNQSLAVDPDPELVPPKTIVVNGRVGGIVPGPLEPVPSSSDKDSDKKKDDKEAPINFTVFPRGSAGDYRRLTEEGGGVPAIVFSGPAGPGFFGTASVPGGVVSLQFSYQQFTYGASTLVDAEGNWMWDAAHAFPNGEYTLVAKLLDPHTFKELARHTLRFHQINSDTKDLWRLVPVLEEGQQTTDIIVTPVSGYETVRLGNEVKARIHLFGFTQSQPLLLEYIVLGPNGDVYLRQTESLDERRSETFVKSFFTKEDLSPGKYMLLVRAVAGNQVALGSAIFTFEGERENRPGQPPEEGKSIQPIFLWLFVLILVLDILLFILLLQRNRLRWWQALLLLLNNILIFALFVFLGASFWE